MGEEAEKDNPVDRFLVRGKDSVALIRDGLLLVIALLLLVFPATFNDVLTKAGFEEGSFAGLKWKAKLVEATDQLSKADASVKVLQKQLGESARLLRIAQAQVADANLRRSIVELNVANQRVTQESAKVQESVATTIQANKPIVDKARLTIGEETLRRLAIVPEPQRN